MTFTLSHAHLIEIQKRAKKAAKQWRARDAFAICIDGWHYHKWENDKCARCGITK